MSERPWYHEGLRFTCTACGDCCTGDEGFVWANKEEIAALAQVVGEADIEEFERLYIRKVGVRKSLKELPNGDCIFFDSEKRLCQVYTARPRQCRTWPFWNSNLRNPKAWENTCRLCPGSGRGKLHSFDQVEAQRNVIRV